MIRAELAKLATVRGTWVVCAAAVALSAALTVAALAPDNDLGAPDDLLPGVRRRARVCAPARHGVR
jgi:hypothetical protein